MNISGNIRLTRGNIIQATYSPETMTALIDRLRLVLVARYLETAAADVWGAETDQSVVACKHCGEMTMYSAALVHESQLFDKLCLSSDCLREAIFSVSSILNEPVSVDLDRSFVAYLDSDSDSDLDTTAG